MRWYNTIKKWLVSEGFKPEMNDPCAFTHPNGLRIAIKMSVQADDERTARLVPLACANYAPMPLPS